MAIKYCDYLNGTDYYALTAWLTATSYSVNDVRKNGTAAYKCIQNHTSGDLDDEPGVGAVWTTYWSLEGDGSNTDPYKTITDASRGLTGNDEVRAAKSTASTSLTGTLGFTLNSTAVTGSGTLFNSELAIGDFIKGGDNQWYEVITITDDENAILYRKYPGSTGAGVSSQKLGVTSTGAAPSINDPIQTVSVSGSSVGNELKISGGWDLSTITQDGQTYFRQMHGTFDTRHGWGLYFPNRYYVEIERLHFLRYNSGLHLSGSSNNIFTSPTCSGNNRGIYLVSGSDDNTFTTPICNGNTYGFQGNLACGNTITTPICNSNSQIGLYLQGLSNNNTITSPTCNSNSNYGIYINTGSNNTFTSVTCNNNTDGFYLSSRSNSNTITTLTCEGNTKGLHVASSLNNTFTSVTCNNNTDGIYISLSSRNTFITTICNGNSNSGVYSLIGSNNIFVTLTCNNNTAYGIYSTTSLGDIVNNYSSSGNGTDINVLAGKHYGESPCVQVQHLNAAGINKCFYEYGVTERNTADAKSTQCLKYDPTSATYYIIQSFFFKADSGVAQTLSAYIKDDVSFNGDIQAAIYFMEEKITGWTEWTPTTSYVQKSIIAAAGDIGEDGVIELRIKVRGTAGNVFVDDLATA